jgi:hypothetical protein
MDTLLSDFLQLGIAIEIRNIGDNNFYSPAKVGLRNVLSSKCTPQTQQRKTEKRTISLGLAGSTQPKDGETFAINPGRQP